MEGAKSVNCMEGASWVYAIELGCCIWTADILQVMSLGYRADG